MENQAAQQVHNLKKRNDLLDKILPALEARAEVVGVWLTGSLAEDAGDEYSDVDLRVVISADATDIFLRDLSEILRSITDLVLFQRRGHLVNVVTRDWLRVDLLITPDVGLRAPGGPSKILVDPDGALASAMPRAAAATDAEKARDVVDEFIRCLGLLVFVAERREWISAYQGTLAMIGLFVELLQLESGTHRGVGGALSLNRRLREDQMELIEEIPALRPTERSVIDVQTWLAKHFLLRARDLFDERVWTYPSEFERATLDRLSRAGFIIDFA